MWKKQSYFLNCSGQDSVSRYGYCPCQKYDMHVYTNIFVIFGWPPNVNVLLTSQELSSSLTNKLHDPHPNVCPLIFNFHFRGRVLSMCEKVNVTLTIGEISLPGQVAYIKDKYHGSLPKPTAVEEGCGAPLWS